MNPRLLARLRSQAQELAEFALAQIPELPQGVTPEGFLAEASVVGPFDHYKLVPAAARQTVSAVQQHCGDAGLRAFLRAVLATGVAQVVVSPAFQELPARVAIDHLRHMARIAADVSYDADWLSVDNDLFQKELGLVTLRLYAAGAQLVDPRCGLPRSLIWRGGWAASLRKALDLHAMGAVRPWLQIHTHRFNLDAFNEAGWDECYRCCADLYRLHPETFGMFGGSWFYDPVLQDISPKLAYLRERPAAGGARLWLYERGGDAIDNALATSPTRRKLHDEGKYLPTSYMLIWPKADQIRWAKQHPMPIETLIKAWAEPDASLSAAA